MKKKKKKKKNAYIIFALKCVKIDKGCSDGRVLENGLVLA